MGFIEYIRLGFIHVLPSGLDHILFIITVFFVRPELKKIVVSASLFTLAHSITLFLGAFGMIRVNASLTEPLIAMSITVSALQNLLKADAGTVRMIIIFGFGLLHGLGFAAVLDASGIAGISKVAGILGFNLGVELAQIAIIVLLFYGLVKHVRQYEWYHSRLLPAVSVCIAAAGIYLFINRLIA